MIIQNLRQGIAARGMNTCIPHSQYQYSWCISSLNRNTKGERFLVRLVIFSALFDLISKMSRVVSHNDSPSSPPQPPSPPPSPPLALNARGRFKIVQLTDLHYMGNAEPDTDARSDAFQERLLLGGSIGEADADFVVFTGDMVSGWVYMNKPTGEKPKDWYAGIHSQYTKGEIN